MPARRPGAGPAGTLHAPLNAAATTSTAAAVGYRRRAVRAAAALLAVAGVWLCVAGGWGGAGTARQRYPWSPQAGAAGQPDDAIVKFMPTLARPAHWSLRQSALWRPERAGAAGRARAAAVVGDDESGNVIKPLVPSIDTGPNSKCTIDNLGACSQEELELMYVDVLWSYYEEKKQVVSDAQFDSLVAELNWQGSGFATLRRSEIQFVKAAIAFAKGEPVVNDAKWEKMKEEVKASTGKRQAVTQFLLFTRSLRETALNRERLEQEIAEAGLTLTASPMGISCVLSDTPTTFQLNVRDVLEMYVVLSAVPTGICSAAWAVVALLAGGPDALFSTAHLGLPAAGVASYGITSQLIKYVELAQPQLLVGQCPCCEAEVKHMATSYTNRMPALKCGTCATEFQLDVDKQELGKVGGLNYIGAEQDEKWFDEVLQTAALQVSDTVLGKPNEQTFLGTMAKGEGSATVSADTPVFQYTLENIKEGIFAWAVLLGYGLFGEAFVGRVRGKGIAIHSQAINDFCARYAIPAELRQKYIQTAKRNGHDLGFLVQGQKLYGDGLFGKEAMAWWKEQGF